MGLIFNLKIKGDTARSLIHMRVSETCGLPCSPRKENKGIR